MLQPSTEQSVFQLLAGMCKCGYSCLSKGDCRLAEDTHFQFLIFFVFYCLITITEMPFQHSHHQFIPSEQPALPVRGTEAETAAAKITVCIFPMYLTSSAGRGGTTQASSGSLQQELHPELGLDGPMSSCPVPRSMAKIQSREADVFHRVTDLI